MILVIVASLVGGGIYWNWKADQDRQAQETQDFTCQLMGGC